MAQNQMSTHPINADSVASFLRSYIAAFNACDGGAIAAHYAYPSLSLRGDGVLLSLNSREQAERLFASMARTYVEQGCVDWRAENVALHSIGSRSALVSVDWSMLRADGSPLRTWTHSYNLIADGSQVLIVLATFNFSAPSEV